MYLIKYALTKGIVRVTPKEGEGNKRVGELINLTGYSVPYFYGCDLVDTEEEAIEGVKIMVKKKIKSLKKSLSKYENFEAELPKD